MDISGIPDENGHTCVADINPLERFAVLENGEKVYLSERYATYEWDENLLTALPNCLKRADQSASQVAASKHQQQASQSTNYRDYESMRLVNSSL